MSKLFFVQHALEQYEREAGELPQMHSNATRNSHDTSWRVEIAEWMNESGFIENRDKNNDPVPGETIFTCFAEKDERGSDILGVFTIDGDWAFQSDLRHQTARSKWVLIMMPGKNHDWTKAGDILLKEDGSTYYWAPPSAPKPVNITGCISLDSSGIVTVITGSPSEPK